MPKKNPIVLLHIYLLMKYRILQILKKHSGIFKLKTWDIYCTGSNADLFSGELSTYLSGRYIEIEIYSLSYPEFLDFHKLQDNTDSFGSYIKFGGLPYLINLELKERIVFDYLKNIYAAILYKDVVARYNIRNASFLEKLTHFVADNIGQLQTAKSITNF